MPDREQSVPGAAQPCTEYPAPRNCSEPPPQMLQWEANDRRTCARPHPCLVLKRAKIQAGSCWRATCLYYAVPRHAAITARSSRYLDHSGTCWAEAVSRSDGVRKGLGSGCQGQGECAASNFFLFALPPVAELARQFSHASVLSPRSSLLIHAAIRLLTR